MNISTRIPTRAAIAVALILAIAAALILAIPASPQEGSLPAAPARSTSTAMLDSSNCSLARVQDHFVRCDNLTGAGVPAPSWVPELKPRQAVLPPVRVHGVTP